MQTKHKLDQSFFIFGLMILSFSAALPLVQAQSVAPDGLDPTFGVGGRVITPGLHAASVAIQPDGKIVTAGSLGYGSIVLARYTPDGVLDPTFGGDGWVFASAQGYQCTIALTSNGKIVVAVSDKSGRVSPPITFVLLRFNSNGSLDTTFGGDGIITPTFNGYPNASAYNVVVQADGKIIAVGFVREPSYIPKSAVARFNDDGGIDTSFSGDGLVVGTSFENSAVTIQPDGKILAAGHIFGFGRFTVSRYNVDGSADTSFNSVGYAAADFGDYAYANDIVIQPDGKIVVAGSNYSDFALARFNSNGSLDNSFDYDGKVTTPFGGYEHGANAVAIQPDGKIVAGGSHTFFDEKTWEWHYFGIDLARYNNDGSLDTSFSGDGKVTNSLGAGHYAADFAIRSDGKIVGAGFQSGVGLLLARYLGDSVIAPRTRFDFDGDEKADVSVFRPSDRVWYLLRSQSGFTSAQFGISTDKLAPADFDRDGKTDIAVFREGVWYWLNSSNASFNAVQFGTAGDVPVPADYTGDGRVELAVYRSAIWYTLNLSNNQFQGVQFGIASDKPVPADYDGDGKTDIAVVRQDSGVSNWYIIGTSRGFYGLQFGTDTDKPVSADYDGDGKADVAVYRNGFWYVLGSTQGFYGLQFGIASDIPAAADYDGDGKADIAVYRDGIWYLLRSQHGFSAVQFGTTNDKPIPASYVP